MTTIVSKIMGYSPFLKNLKSFGSIDNVLNEFANDFALAQDLTINFYKHTDIDPNNTQKNEDKSDDGGKTVIVNFYVKLGVYDISKQKEEEDFFAGLRGYMTYLSTIY